MSTINSSVLVYGRFGHHGDVGESLIREALLHLFSSSHGLSLCFADVLSSADVKSSLGVIFASCNVGDKPIIESTELLRLLASGKVPVFYLGIDLDNVVVNPDHLAIMKVAKVVVTRSAPESIPASVRAVTQSVYSMPDLAWCMPSGDALVASSPSASTLFIPNGSLVPAWDSPHSDHLSWERFRDSVASFLDHVWWSTKKRPTFLLMSSRDSWSASEIVSRMRSYHGPTAPPASILDATSSPKIISFLSGFDLVISQRYHGTVLAQMARVPHVSIDDSTVAERIWPRKGTSVKYGNVSRETLIEARELTLSQRPLLPEGSRESFALAYAELAKTIVDIVLHSS